MRYDPALLKQLLEIFAMSLRNFASSADIVLRKSLRGVMNLQKK
jgi:hypothetical protein